MKKSPSTSLTTLRASRSVDQTLLIKQVLLFDQFVQRQNSFSDIKILRFQLVVAPTHPRGGTLDLLMTDVPDLVLVAVVQPIGNSDHSSLSAVISMALAVPNLCVSRKVFLKHQVNWNAVCGAIRDLPWRNIWLADNPVNILSIQDKIDVVLSILTVFLKPITARYGGWLAE